MTSRNKALEAWDLFRHHYKGQVDGLSMEFPPDAETVRIMYRTIASETHPDKGGETGVFQAVEAARRALVAYIGSGNAARAALDTSTTPCEACSGFGHVIQRGTGLGSKGIRVRCRACGGSGTL